MVIGVFNAQQVVQQAHIAKVELGRLDDALAGVLAPRRQEAHHERVHEQVQVASARRMRHAERPGDLRPVPDLPVIMRHAAEAESVNLFAQSNAAARC